MAGDPVIRGKWTLNNMNRTLIGILCQKMWLHACITFQSISLSLTFNCGINHSPPQKKAGPIWMNALDYEKQPLNNSQKLWLETKV